MEGKQFSAKGEIDAVLLAFFREFGYFTVQPGHKTPKKMGSSSNPKVWDDRAYLGGEV